MAGIGRQLAGAGLRVAGAVKRFGPVTALDGFDLSVAPGEIAGLVGHNGAGKSTFARVVAGLVPLDGGTVVVDGERRPERARAHLGLAPQELALYPTATARENLLFFAGLFGLRRAEAGRRARQLAEALALDGLLDRRVRDLSGGQQRRVQAATAMVHRPPVLLLDEPTVGADPLTRDALLGAVRQAAGEGAAVVYTTHYLPELDLLDATLAVADRGRVIARGHRADLLAGLAGRAELDFDGPPPALRWPTGSGPTGSGPTGSGDLTVSGNRVTVTAPEPAAAVACLLAAHPEAAGRLRSVALRPPTLDDLYRQLVRR